MSERRYFYSALSTVLFSLFVLGASIYYLRYASYYWMAIVIWEGALCYRTRRRGQRLVRGLFASPAMGGSDSLRSK